MPRTSVIAVALVALAAGGGFGVSALLHEAAPPAARAAAAAPAVDPPGAAAPPEDRGSVAASAEEPLTEVGGSVAGTRMGLLSLRRAGPDVLVARVRLTASRSARRQALEQLYFGNGELAAWNVSGMELRDRSTGRATLPEVPGPDRCDCSDFDGLRPGESIELGATFKLGRDAKGPFTLRLPHFPEIAGITAGDA